MSIGIFRSIRGSYIESARGEADAIIGALNEELRRRGWVEYRDPDPDEHELKPLPCGHASASTLADLAGRAAAAGSALTIHTLRGARGIALPIDFEGKITVSTGRTFLIFGQRIQEFYPVRTVLAELAVLAPLLGVPLVDGTVTAEIADRLADCLPMPGEEETAGDGDLENQRALWLDLHLASRYGLQDGTPVVLAG